MKIGSGIDSGISFVVGWGSVFAVGSGLQSVGAVADAAVCAAGTSILQ